MSCIIRRCRMKWVAALLGICAMSGVAAAGDGWEAGVEIRRTGDGVPHIRATTWHGLGMGFGYAQAEDALCTLAEAFVTFAGRRSYFFGTEQRPHHHSTFGRPRNLDLDLFFRAFIDDWIVQEYRRRQPDELNDLVDGFAVGYNRYLHEVRTGSTEGTSVPTCLDQEWVREIAPEDIYRRMYAGGLAAGYSRFIPEIVNASPQGDELASAKRDLAQRLSMGLGEHAGLGSNALAFGGAVTGAEGGVLFGNPHWFWGGPDRFYQAHLTIPGRLNVAGVSFLGIPLIMIGFNENVAWSHTVSAARRFGLFELALAPDDPTAYRHDGEYEAMRPVPVTVEVRNTQGEERTLTRTLYRSRFGPLVDFSGHAEAFGWGEERALALRDINADNFRIFRTYLRWNQAESLDEFVAIQRREAATPWVNTVAVGRGDERVWLGDIGAVPNVSDALREACPGSLSEEFASVDPVTPLLDGSRGECVWREVPEAVQQGAMPVDHQPGLFREDYVANMNDSYWLSNARQPMEGFARVLGGERDPLSLRGRYGHRLALSLIDEAPGSAERVSEWLREAVLASRAYSADLAKHAVLEATCGKGSVTVKQDPLDGKRFDSPVTVDLAEACQVLSSWQNTGNADDRGALLWDTFWARVSSLPPDELYRVPFSPGQPLSTPREIRVEYPRIGQALGAAVLALSTRGMALDAPRGDYLYARSAGREIPLYGGCSSVGYFTIACSGGMEEGRYVMDDTSHGNSYLQVVHFGDEGVEAFTLLAHGQRESALGSNGKGSEAVERYAAKGWRRIAFQEEEISGDPELSVTTLEP